MLKRNPICGQQHSRYLSVSEPAGECSHLAVCAGGGGGADFGVQLSGAGRIVFVLLEKKFYADNSHGGGGVCGAVGIVYAGI